MRTLGYAGLGLLGLLVVFAGVYLAKLTPCRPAPPEEPTALRTACDRIAVRLADCTRARGEQNARIEAILHNCPGYPVEEEQQQ
jgi:hypothetical protein